jgi:glycerol kinase
VKNGFILSIDKGATGSTVLIFNHAGQVGARAYSEFSQHYPKPGWVEHDAEEIVVVTMKVISDTLRAGRINSDDVQAIGITNQRETVVVGERDSGTPVGRAIVWQDRRTARYCDELKARGLEDMVREKTGLVIDPYFSGTKMEWILDNNPGLRQRAERGELCFGTIDSWLVYRLTGGKVHITDYSNEKLLTTIAWRIGDEPVEYALEGAIFVTGSAVQWLRDGLGMIKQASETRELARAVPDNEGVYFVPALVGLGAPHWDPYARGLLIGITRGTGKGHVARGAGEHGLSDPRRHRGHAAGLRYHAEGAALRRRRVRQQRADAVPIGHPWRRRRGAEHRRDHRPRLRLSGGTHGRLLGEQDRDRREVGARRALSSASGRGQARTLVQALAQGG